ncbi:MAG: HAMP domain-containing histidine kinase [Oligoflexia bacterium]|nr:HAMP domain-containing histidine kinase [Oligoflexia bacterium]
MSSWSFARRIFSAFLALTILFAAIAAVAGFSLRSLALNHRSLVEREGKQVEQCWKLNRLQDQRVSALRGFLISKNRDFLKAERRIDAEFDRILGSMLSTFEGDPTVSPLLQQIGSYEADYAGFIRRAVNDPARATWILETLVRPRRLDLERSLGRLDEVLQGRLDAGNAAFMNGGLRAIRALGALAAAELVLLLGLGWLLYRTVREEQRTLAHFKEARDTLEGAERRAAFLAQTGKIVTESSEPKAALPRVAQLAVEWLSTACLIELTDGSGLLQPSAIAIAHTPREPLLRSLHRDLPQGLGSLFATSQILQSGRPILTPLVQEARLLGLGIRTFMAVPLRARNRVLGVLLLFKTDSEKAYDELSMQFTLELSHQIALAIDNARLLQQAEEGLKMREELLSIVAHDLKNPLTSIRMNGEMLLRQGEPGTSRIARLIHDSIAEMEQLIHDLLELTKIESGRIILDRRPHDAEELVSSCLKVLGPQAEARNIELIKEVRPGECIADCDRSRVVQVLSNLVGNAIKFTEKGGRVRIEAQATGEGIRFSVIDNGPGIPTDELPHVFDRYWQARRTTGSAGLGLSIARGIIEAHGGRVWVESALHIGSRFFFTLPEARKQVQPKVA